MEQFGAYLKAQREKKGIRLEEIASITKIHLHSLELLEAGQWDTLPPEPFIRGFIIAYAKYVGLDSKEAIGKYLEEVGGAPGASAGHEMNGPMTPAAHSAPPADVIQKIPSLPGRKILTATLGVGLVAVMIGIIYVGKQSSHRKPLEEVRTLTETQLPAKVGETKAATPEPVAAAAPAATKAPVAVATAETSPQPAVATQPTTTPQTTSSVAPASEAQHEVVVESANRSWMKVVIDDKPPVESYLAEGQKVNFSAAKKIKVVLGNSVDSKVFHNGVLAAGAQYQGTIRYYIFPAHSRFPQDVAKKTTTPASQDSASSRTPSSSDANTTSQTELKPEQQTAPVTQPQ